MVSTLRGSQGKSCVLTLKVFLVSKESCIRTKLDFKGECDKHSKMLIEQKSNARMIQTRELFIDPNCLHETSCKGGLEVKKL